MSENIAPLLMRREHPELGFHQGIVVSWNNNTGANTIKISGSNFSNLPILNTSEASSLNSGDLLGVLRYRHQYFILGRIAIPGSLVFGASAIAFSAAHSSLSNFVVPGDAFEDILIDMTIVPPKWATRALVLLTVNLSAVNTSTVFGFLTAQAKVDTFVGSNYLTGVAVGGQETLTAGTERNLFELGSTVRLALRATIIQGNTWSAHVNNRCSLSGVAVFKEV